MFVNESFILQMGQHTVDGGGRDPEVTLQIGVCGRSAVDFGVVVDEGEILALLIGIGGDIFIRVRDRHGVYFMIYYPFYHEGLSHAYHLSGVVDGGGAGLFGGIYIPREATGTGVEAGADIVVGGRRRAA